MMEDPDERLEYAAVHFWDVFSDTSAVFLCDSAHIGGLPADEVEEQVGRFSRLLEGLPAPVARRAVSAAFDRFEACRLRDTASNVFSRMTDHLSHYLYDPNSPVRNEDAWLPYVQKLSTSPLVPPERQAGYEWEARLCALNPVGSRAADFRFIDLRGRRHTLYGVQAPLTLLFFSNPGCPSCREIVETLTGDQLVEMLTASETMAVVNVYIDQEYDKWAEYARTYPPEWISGYDPDYVIRTDLTYNVRAIPSLYLLDAEKTVLLKDAPVERVLGRLHAMWTPAS